MKCGRKRVWIDPNETNEVALANSRKYHIFRFLRTSRLPSSEATSLLHISIRFCRMLCVVSFSQSSIKILIITVNVGKNIRKLVKDRLIMRRQTTMHSRSRAKAWAESKRKGKQIYAIPVNAPLMNADLQISYIDLLLFRSSQRSRTQKG